MSNMLTSKSENGFRTVILQNPDGVNAKVDNVPEYMVQYVQKMLRDLHAEAFIKPKYSITR